jgi:hypothetical protein
MAGLDPAIHVLVARDVGRVASLLYQPVLSDSRRSERMKDVDARVEPIGVR